jgi:hypothetical protein
MVTSGHRGTGREIIFPKNCYSEGKLNALIFRRLKRLRLTHEIGSVWYKPEDQIR